MESTALSNADTAGRSEMDASRQLGHLQLVKHNRAPILQPGQFRWIERWADRLSITLGRCQQINGQQAASDTGKHEHVFHPGSEKRLQAA